MFSISLNGASTLAVAALCYLASSLAPAGSSEHLPPPTRHAMAQPPAGVQFNCAAVRWPLIEIGMTRYLAELQIDPALYSVHRDEALGILRYTLNTPAEDRSTLDFVERAAFAIPLHHTRLPAGGGKFREVSTVSPKEIMLALMQHGRLTEFSGAACDVAALREHVGLRQNIVAWAEVLEWGWPNGNAARWNRKFWKAGDPEQQQSLSRALTDVFINQKHYRIGCFTAAKLVVVQGILDYYVRIRQDGEKARLVEARLRAGKSPLLDVEPGGMWRFDSEIDPQERERPGRMLRIVDDIAPHNFIPGDWPRFVNTDPASYQKMGYEGSNPIYLGRNRFVDYYNDNRHSYTFEEKLDEVYQWRHGVFSRQRDKDKIRPLSHADLQRLARSPAEGGLLTPLRGMPYYFGYEPLPEIVLSDKSTATSSPR